VNVVPALIPHHQASHLAEPTQGALDDPSVSSQFLLRLSASAGNARDNIPLSEHLSGPFRIVGFIGMELARPFAGAPDAG
jgi:hypothetical protein